MSAALSLVDVLRDPRVWRGSADAVALATEPTGHATLDAALPGQGWPQHALSEILIPLDGIGELALIVPTLARLTQAQKVVVLVAPPYVAYPLAWGAQGVVMRHLHFIDATGRDALWATEQCLRSGACAAVVCWPLKADDRALRRLQVAAETGRALGFAYRPSVTADNPSPAATRVQLTVRDAQTLVRVVKCRGGRVPATTLTFRSRRRP